MNFCLERRRRDHFIVRSGRGERLVSKGAEKRTQSRLKVGADLLTFAAGILLGSMFGECVGALTKASYARRNATSAIQSLYTSLKTK